MAAWTLSDPNNALDSAHFTETFHSRITPICQSTTDFTQLHLTTSYACNGSPYKEQGAPIDSESINTPRISLTQIHSSTVIAAEALRELALSSQCHSAIEHTDYRLEDKHGVTHRCSSYAFDMYVGCGHDRRFRHVLHDCDFHRMQQ